MRPKLYFLMIMLIACSPLLHGQIPETMSYQGALTDAGGNPVPDGNVSLTFRLYDVASGGTALWEETQEVAVSSGIFNAVLGSSTPLNLPFDKPYWLGITVEQGMELASRVPLSASPYSMNSRQAMAEPPNGQGITVRNLAGETTHVLYEDGDAFHRGKTTIGATLRISTEDTAIVVTRDNQPAFIFQTTSSPSSAGRSGRPSSINRDPSEVMGGDQIIFGGNLEFVNGSTHDTETTVGLDGLSTGGKVVADEGISTIGEIDARSLHILGAGGDTLASFNSDGTSYHKGLERFENGIAITGEGQGILFPDGSKQTTAGIGGGAFDGTLQGKALVVKSASGNEVFRVDTNGTSLHKGDETFEGDVILRGTGGKGAKLVDSTGLTLAGFGRLDLDTGQRIGVYGRAQRPGDLAGAFEGDVDVNGEVTANSLHVVNSNNQPVFTVNSDGTSTHSGLESYSQGIVVPLSNGNILRLDPAEGFTIKTAGGDFIAHIRYDGATFFAGGKSAVVKTPSFGERAMYSDESTELWFTDRGSGELANGEAVIDLDPMFRETVTIDGDHPMIVRVTATDECNGMYVAEKASDHFVVKELMGGRSNATFDWEASGKRRGYENTRMEPYESDEGSSK
jgi:hypothetical protein